MDYSSMAAVPLSVLQDFHRNCSGCCIYNSEQHLVYIFGKNSGYNSLRELTESAYPALQLSDVMWAHEVAFTFSATNKLRSNGVLLQRIDVTWLKTN